MRGMICFCRAFVFLAALSVSVYAQTEGTCSFTVSTARTYIDFDPRHVLAIWVTDASGSFVKTLMRRAAKRTEYLYTWREESNENVVDAVTGATLNSHETHTVTWDCRDTAGEVVPDGTYRIRVEFTSEHAQGPLTPASHIEFTKGPEQVSITPADLTYFKDMSLTYTPDIETHVLVPAESVWKYNDTGTDLHATGWTQLGYDDSSWMSGPGKLGYRDHPATELSYGDDAGDKHPCYYFRHVFTLDYVPDSLKVRVLRDDGVVVYLNGIELVRDNMDAGQTSYDDLASDTVAGSEENTYHVFRPEAAALVEGDNIIAAEVHQADPGSSDLGFDLELKASPPSDEAPVFTRGDANNDTSFNIADVVFILNYLFAHREGPACLSACDTNDDNVIDISDPVTALAYLFGELESLPEPFTECGEDPTADALPCRDFSNCQ